jgi:hypothetical protein
MERAGGKRQCVGRLLYADLLEMLLPSADVVDDCLKVAAVWVSSGAIGTMLGSAGAVAQKKPLKTIELWGFLGGAMGCAFGFLLMICAVAALTR